MNLGDIVSGIVHVYQGLNSLYGDWRSYPRIESPKAKEIDIQTLPLTTPFSLTFGRCISNSRPTWQWKVQASVTVVFLKHRSQISNSKALQELIDQLGILRGTLCGLTE